MYCIIGLLYGTSSDTGGIKGGGGASDHAYTAGPDLF